MQQSQDSNVLRIQKSLCIVISISGIFVTIANIILQLAQGATFYKIISTFELYTVLIVTTPILFFSFVNKKNIFAQILQILILFISSIIAILDGVSEFPGTILWVLAIMLLHKYNLLKKYKIIKLFIAFILLIAFTSFANYNKTYDSGITVGLFILAIGLVCSLILRSELKIAINYAIKFNKRKKEIIRERDRLKEVIKREELRIKEIDQRINRIAKKDPLILENYNFTNTEIKILELLVVDKGSNKDIAKLKNIKEGTVKIHLNNIYKKTNLSKRSDLIMHFEGCFKEFEYGKQ